MKTTYTEKASDLLSEMIKEVTSFLQHKGTPCIEYKRYCKELNYHICEVWFLEDDNQTIWVRWGKYNDSLTNLPITAIATIVDNILREGNG